MKTIMTKPLYLIMFALLSLALLAGSLGVSQESTPAVAVSSKSDLVQFTVGGHILAFGADGMTVAGSDHALRVSFAGAQAVKPTTSGGKDFQVVTYSNLWTGISLNYYASQNGILESVYTLAAGSDPGQIRLGYNSPVHVNPDGSLSTRFERGEMRESAPLAWQVIDGQRKPVEVAFKQSGEREVAFALGQYDPAYPVTIDPELSWTPVILHGGDGPNDTVKSLVIDSAGNTYVTGLFEGLLDGSPDSDAFVAKIDVDGTLLVTHRLGGAGVDQGLGIAIDDTGTYAYVAGKTASSDSPWNADSSGDAFVAKVDLSGTVTDNNAVIWVWTKSSTYGEDRATAIVENGGFLYVAGFIAPATGSRQPFVAKLNLNNVESWMKLLGPTDAYFQAEAIATDGTNVYVGGTVYDLPTDWPSTVAGGAYKGNYDGFIAQLSSDGTEGWHRFVGSQDGYDSVKGLAIDSTGIYVSGSSDLDWTMGAAPKVAYTGGDDAYVAKFGLDGAPLWNTFIGTALSNESEGSLALTSDNNNIYLVGTTNRDWGTFGAGAPGRSYVGGYDGFVVKIDNDSASPNYGKPTWHAFLGGANSAQGDYANAVGVYNNFPVVAGKISSGWDDPSDTDSDGFVASFEAGISPTIVGMVRSDNTGDPVGTDSVVEYVSGNTVYYTITFSEPVTGLDVGSGSPAYASNDFSLAAGTDKSSTAQITAVSYLPNASAPSYSDYLITVTVGAVDGSICLDAFTSGVKDADGNPLSVTSVSACDDGRKYFVDRTVNSLTLTSYPPVIKSDASIPPAINNAIHAATFTWTVAGGGSPVSVTCKLEKLVAGVLTPVYPYEPCDGLTKQYGTDPATNLLGFGAYTFTVTSRDALDNVDTKTYSWTITRQVTYTSVGAQDGWILEKGETYNTGGSLNYLGTDFFLGDAVGDKQYRAILSFTTTGFPVGATIVNTKLRLRYEKLVGTNPFITLTPLKIDIRKGYFGTAATLALADFGSAASANGAGTVTNQNLGGYYYGSFTSLATFANNINRAGVTQLRLRFFKDDNDNNINNYIAFFSGNHANLNYRPKLIIDYIP